MTKPKRESYIRGQKSIKHTGNLSKCKRFNDSSEEECSVFSVCSLDNLYSLLHSHYKSDLFLCLCKNFHINKKLEKAILNQLHVLIIDRETKVTLTQHFHLEL